MIWILMFVLLSGVVEAQITEIHYNPPGSDNNFEYVEVALANLSGFSILDIDSSDNLTLLKFFESNFSLIVEDGFNHSEINASIYSVGSNIGNGLNNDRDILLLKNASGKVVDVAYYSSEMGGGGNNRSLCRKDFSFIECEKSPGFLSAELNFTIKISEFLPDPDGDDSVGEWIELYNYGHYNLNLEGLALSDNSGKKLFISNVLTNSTIINAGDYMVVKMNNFSGFLNNEGFEKIFLEDIDEVSYSGSREGISWSKLNEEWIKSVPTPGTSNVEKKLDTRIKIEKLNFGTDKKVKFGEIFYVTLKVLRGDTTKKSIKIYVKGNETVSKITTFSIENRFMENKFTLPVALKNECFNGGKYELVVEGLNEVERRILDIADNTELCKKNTTTTKAVKNVPLRQEKSESNLNEISGRVVYEAKDLKAERSGIYFFCVSLIMLLIYFAWMI